MKTICLVALICLAITSNAIIYPTITQDDVINARETVAQNLDVTKYDVVAGIMIGYFKALELGEPVDAIHCYTQDSATAFYNFLFGLANVAYSSNTDTLNEALAHFWSRAGNNEYSSLTSSHLSCLRKSKDFQNVKNMFGIDPYSEDYGTKFVSFITKNREFFLDEFTLIHKALNAGAFEKAGANLAYWELFVARKFEKTDRVIRFEKPSV